MSRGRILGQRKYRAWYFADSKWARTVKKFTTVTMLAHLQVVHEIFVETQPVLLVRAWACPLAMRRR